MAEKLRLSYGREVQVPTEMQGWEEMYPPHRLFSPERQEWEDNQFWYAYKIHAPDPWFPSMRCFVLLCAFLLELPCRFHATPCHHNELVLL